MKKLIQYLNLDRIGFLEFLFAITPILIGFSFKGFPLSLGMYLIMLIVTANKRKKVDKKISIFKPIILLLLYVLVHDFVLVIAVGKNFLGFIQTIITLFSIIYITPALDIEKLKGALNWVCIIALIGLSYQMTFVLAGQGVHHLGLPFLEMSEARLESEGLRPSSFFMEPAAYASFMFVTMALALMQRKFVWVGVLTLGVFLTGSTTGLIASFLLIGAYMVTQKLDKRYLIIVFAMGGIMFYSLQNFEIFDIGVNKLLETDVETNVRLVQGPRIVSTMEPLEYIFGVFYRGKYAYCVERASMVYFYGEDVYMSTFWLILLIYGVVGILLYLNVYRHIVKKLRDTIPLVVVMVVLMFSSSHALGAIFAFSTTVLLSLIYNKENILV